MKFTKILMAIGLIVIVIQFIRPTPNKNKPNLSQDLLSTVSTSDSIKQLYRNACYDCHSNNTNYPWYTNVQPIGWIMDNHIKEGKEDLNFSEFASYSKRRQISKLNGIVNSIKDNDMPLSSYKLMHSNARLTDSEKMLMITWAKALKDSISNTP